MKPNIHLILLRIYWKEGQIDCEKCEFVHRACWASPCKQCLKAEKMYHPLICQDNSV